MAEHPTQRTMAVSDGLETLGARSLTLDHPNPATLKESKMRGKKPKDDTYLRLNRPVVVAVGAINENCGGTIVLHRLIDGLRKLGIAAYGYPVKNFPRETSKWKQHIKILRRHRKKVAPIAGHYAHPSMDTRLAPLSVLYRNPIVVYPEVIHDNPFNATAVVRWILYVPGFFTGQKPDFHSKDEEFFFYQRLFVNEYSWVPTENELRLQWIRDDIYFDKKLPQRSGSCRMVRKGARTVADTSDTDKASRILDGLSHEEIAQAFNECEFFYCDDPHTMYSTYAVLCGCVAIVTPQPGVSEPDWRPESERWGIAYGNTPEQIDFAKRTMHKMPGKINELRAAEDRQLRHFVSRLSERFC